MLSYSEFKGVTALENAAQNNPYLKRGANGPAIAAVQRALVRLGHPMPKSTKAGQMDGIYGSETSGAIAAFQSARPPLKKDGILGKNTMTALDGAMISATKPTKIVMPPITVTVPNPKVVKFKDDDKYDLHLERWSSGYVCRLTMAIKFQFADGDAAAWTNAAEKRNFMTAWKQAVEAHWSLGNLYTSPRYGIVPFYVRIDATMGASSEKEWTLNVTKIPTGTFRTSWVSDGFIWNTSAADSEDNKGANKGASMLQRASVHEFGHMLGLSDEYAASAPWFQWWDVPNQGDTDSIMHSGERIRRRHHEAFREWVKKYFNE